MKQFIQMRLNPHSLQKVSIYQSNAYVNPRDQKYVLTKNNTIRQFGAVRHIQDIEPWLKENQVKFQFQKLATLILNKSHLDPYGMDLKVTDGMMHEG